MSTAGLSDTVEALVLDRIWSAATYTPPGTYYYALFSVAPTDAGGGTELTGNAYARVAITNNATNFPAATGTDPTQKLNATVITFPTATPSAWTEAVAFGIFDAATVGNLIAWNYLGATAGRLCTGATSDTITVPGHTFAVNDRVVFYAYGESTVPTGITAGTIYYVKTIATDTITISTTLGGSTLDITATGAAIVSKISPRTVLAAQTFSFQPNTVQFTAD